ncbi:MAG: hypothetical protein NTU62_12805 [Spirochaetes bacterium]|nr:hypothetical protein [Spirochaetota bacterium]
MDNRELFHATMHRENGGQILHMEQGFNIPYDRWLSEGLPASVLNSDNVELTAGENLYDHFNVAGYLYCTFNQFCIPAFETRVLEETGDRRTYVNENGVTLTVRTDYVPGSTRGSPPHEVDFCIATPADYEENRYRLTGSAAKRCDGLWLERNAESFRTQRDHPVTLWVHGPFAFLREVVGVENAMVLPYTEPQMIRRMLDDHLATSMEAAEPVIRECRPDLCFVWEDCCGSSGPFIAPAMFASLMAPWYRRWKEYLLSLGVPWIMLDTDGDPRGLVRYWYEAGVDCMQPWEVNAVDMLRYAEENPRFVMMGGIYKHMFEPADPAQVGRFRTADVHKAIDDELERVVKPMRARGGYIAALDHWAFWNVTCDGYRHYSNALTERYGKGNSVTRLSPASPSPR